MTAHLFVPFLLKFLHFTAANVPYNCIPILVNHTVKLIPSHIIWVSDRVIAGNIVQKFLCYSIFESEVTRYFFDAGFLILGILGF